MNLNINPDDDLLSIAQDALVSGVIAEACADARDRLTSDPEWSMPKPIHVHDLVTAFVVGVITADPWHRNYSVPPNLERVTNWVAACIQQKFKEQEVVSLSLIEIEGLLREWAMDHKEFRAWNDSPTGEMISVVHRYSEVPDKRDFIDLDALLRNAVLYIRTDRRESEGFWKQFAQEHPEIEEEQAA